MFPSFISILDIQSWWEVPSIAHFCSLFRNAFNLLDFDIEDLEEALLADGTEETSWLQELIVRLLIGCLDKNEKISLFNYQMFLRRLFRQKCKEYDRTNPFNTDIDFQLLPLRTKVDILHALCDFRLDAEDVFEVLKNLEADSLRVEPLGYDNKKSAYWYFYGTRLYREDSPNSDEPIWQVISFTEKDWYKLAEKFKNSHSKCEKGLFQTLSENFIPELPRLFKEKECLARKRLLESLPRRSSNRLIEKSKNIKKDEDKEVLPVSETYQEEKEQKLIKEQREREKRHKKRRKNYADTDKSGNESDNSRSSFQSDQERYEMAGAKTRDKKSKARQRKTSQNSNNSGDDSSAVSTVNNSSNRSCVRTSKKTQSKSAPAGAKPVGRQTNNSLASATDGQILIESTASNPHRKKLKTSQVFSQTEEDLQTGLHKILDHVKNDEDAWPFIDPVEEEYAPNYYTIIRKPMDLQRMEDRLDSGQYKSFSKFKGDFQLLVNNCRLYNGSENEYTEMVDNLVGVFDRAVERYIDQITSSDEEIAVEYHNDVKDKNNKRKKMDSEQSEPPSKRKPSLEAQTGKKKVVPVEESEKYISDYESEEEEPKPKKSKKKEEFKNSNKKEKSTKKERDSGAKKKNKDIEKELESRRKSRKDNEIQEKCNKKYVEENKTKSTKKDVEEYKNNKTKKEDNKIRSNKKEAEKVKNKQKDYEDTKNKSVKEEKYKNNKRDMDDIKQNKNKKESEEIKHKNNKKHVEEIKTKKEDLTKNKTSKKVEETKNKKNKDLDEPILKTSKKSPEVETKPSKKDTQEPKHKNNKHNPEEAKKSHKKEQHIEHEKNKKQSKNAKTKIEAKQLKNDAKTMKKNARKPGRKPKRITSPSPSRAPARGKNRSFSRSLSRSLSRDRWSDSPPPSWPPSSPESGRVKVSPKKGTNKNKTYYSESEDDVIDSKVKNKQKNDKCKEIFKDDRNRDKTDKNNVKDIIDRSPSPPQHKDKHNKLRETIEKLKAKSDLAKVKDKDLAVFDFESEKTKENRDTTQKNDKLKKLDKNKIVKPKVGAKLKDLEDENSTADSIQSSDKTKQNKKVSQNVKGTQKVSSIEALSLATEQTLKDINKWLDDTPKFPEFSSASNSPSHFSPLDDFDSLNNKGGTVDDRKKLDKPLVPRKDGLKELKKRPFTRDPSKIFRRREVQRTIDRLQPGKSKGNLITNVQTTVKQEELFPLGPLGKNKDAKNSLIVKTDESAPKLSLGSVLDSFGKHTFVDDDIKIKLDEKDVLVKKEETLIKPEEPVKDIQDKVVKEEVKKVVEPEKEIKLDNSPGKATPNLSAWFKAFGAPKLPAPGAPATPVYKKIEPKEEKVDEKKDDLLKKVPIADPSPPNNPESPAQVHPVPRQRKISTGSSMSERSSFSQDLDSPRVGMDERMGAYPAPYPSPLHKSPAGASPNLQSPRPDVSPKAAAYPFNGQIRVGFYQDTVSQKSSPDKSCSPRENPQSPYTQYSEHVYTPPTTTQPATYSYNNPYFSHAPSYSTSNPTPPYNAEQNTPANFYDTNKSLTEQYQAKNYVNSPVNQQLNSPQLNSPLNQQMNSPQSVHSPMNQQVNSPMSQPMHSPMNQQAQSPMNQQVQSPMNQQVHSPMNQQVHSPMNQQVHSPMNQQVHSPMNQVHSPMNQQVHSPLNQQVNSPLNQQVNSPLNQQVNSPLNQQVNSPLNHQVNSPISQQVQSPLNQQINSPLNQQLPSPAPQLSPNDAFRQEMAPNVNPFKQKLPPAYKPPTGNMEPFKQPISNMENYNKQNMEGYHQNLEAYNKQIEEFKQSQNIEGFKQNQTMDSFKQNVEPFKPNPIKPDLYNKQKQDMDPFKQVPPNVDPYKPIPTNMEGGSTDPSVNNPFKQALDAYKQAAGNVDIYKQTPSAIDAYKQSPGSMEQYKQSSTSMDGYKQTAVIDPYKQAAANIDAYKQAAAANAEAYKQGGADPYRQMLTLASPAVRQAQQQSPTFRQHSNPNSPNVDYRQTPQQASAEPYRQLQQQHSPTVEQYRQQDQQQQQLQQPRVIDKQTAAFPVKKRAYSEMVGFDSANQDQFAKEQFSSRNLELGLMSGRQVNIGQEQTRLAQEQSRIVQEQARQLGQEQSILLEQRNSQDQTRNMPQEQSRDGASKYVHQNIPEPRTAAQTQSNPAENPLALRNMATANPYTYAETAATSYPLNIPSLDGKIDMSKYTNMGYQGPGDMNFRANPAQYNKAELNYPKPAATTSANTNPTETGAQQTSTSKTTTALQQASSLPMRYTDSGNVMNMGYKALNNAQPQTAHMNTPQTNQRLEAPAGYKPEVTIPRPTYQALEMDQIRGNLANLSHIVDRYQNDERMLQGLQSSASGYYADKNIPTQHMFSKQMAAGGAGLPMFSQPNSMPAYMNNIQAASGMYNRSMSAELQSSGMSVRQEANPSLQQQMQEKKTKRRKTSKTATPPAAPNVETATPGSTTNQGFQSYTGLKNSSGMEPSAISLKTASVVPGSAFNFGPTAPGLAGLSSGLYGDKDAYPNFLEEYRAGPNYYMAAAAAAHHRSTPENAEKPAARAAHQSSNPQAAGPPGYPFIGAPQGRPPSYPHGPFIPPHQAQLMDPSSPLYQQYLQAGVLHQGLIAPHGAYPPGYHALSMRQQYDMTRPSPWL